MQQVVLKGTELEAWVAELEAEQADRIDQLGSAGEAMGREHSAVLEELRAPLAEIKALTAKPPWSPPTSRASQRWRP